MTSAPHFKAFGNLAVQIVFMCRDYLELIQLAML